jgi:hypothetical protein
MGEKTMMEKLIEFTSKNWNSYAIIIKYKRSLFRIKIEELSEVNQAQLNSHDSGEYNVTGSAFLKMGKIIPESISLTFNNYGIPVLLRSHVVRTTEYITYKYKKETGTKFIDIQKNGFLVYCAPTGQGKTWFALSNLEGLGSQFDTILYINLELSIDDIKNRCDIMGVNIPKNLYVAPLDNVDVIMEWCEGRGSVAFIIDNIDNLVGAGDDPFGEQLEFIKKLDRFLKDFNHHALVLTQLVKESTIQVIAKDGEINDAITTNILSGVKQLSYLSRSVMMTAYSNEKATYVYKMLKVGSAKNV